jgi:hypothetical protein
MNIAEATTAVYFFNEPIEPYVLTSELAVDAHDLTFLSNAISLDPEITMFRG